MTARADFIQENIPEQLELKQRMLAEVSRQAAPDVIIASSTSGLTPTDLQRDMHAPGRFCVAHPFNPVYLLPLVELVGGQQTSQQTIDAAKRFFTYIGMHPLHVRREVPGHLTDRLQEALWREILHLVNDGVATTGELDESIIYGPGLRWAGMGTNLIYHLAGGETGMRHMLAQFGPCLKWPWTKLEAPELTDALIDRMVEGTQAQAAGRSIRELERLRDDYLVTIQQVLREHDVGAGSTLRALEARLYADAARDEAPALAREGQPLRVLGTYVRPEWIDYNGHMSESRYLQVFGDGATAALTVKVAASTGGATTTRTLTLANVAAVNAAMRTTVACSKPWFATTMQAAWAICSRRSSWSTALGMAGYCTRGPTCRPAWGGAGRLACALLSWPSRVRTAPSIGTALRFAVSTCTCICSAVASNIASLVRYRR